jgi:hypothetical protein
VSSFIDHITVTAPTLQAGAEYVFQALGVWPQPGGEHPRMGTHNLLLRLGEELFLEVIAPNPLAPAPEQRRWFGLDDLPANATPRLSVWVARTSDIHASTRASTESLGPIEPMSRGALQWLITIPTDGVPPLAGVAPSLIQWHTENHPAGGMPDFGLSLTSLELTHPEPQRVQGLLHSLGLQGPVALARDLPAREARLVAHIQTPNGVRVLR